MRGNYLVVVGTVLLLLLLLLVPGTRGVTMRGIVTLDCYPDPPRIKSIRHSGPLSKSKIIQ